MQQFVKCNSSFPFIKKDCKEPNEKWWIVATINPISHSHPVHHGTFFNVLIDKFYRCKYREIIIFAHNYFKTKHKQSKTLSCITIKYIFLLMEIRYFILLAIHTHSDCETVVCSVYGAFSKQQQGALKVCHSAFSVRLTSLSFLS